MSQREPIEAKVDLETLRFSVSELMMEARSRREYALKLSLQWVVFCSVVVGWVLTTKDQGWVYRPLALVVVVAGLLAAWTTYRHGRWYQEIAKTVMELVKEGHVEMFSRLTKFEDWWKRIRVELLAAVGAIVLLMGVTVCVIVGQDNKSPSLKAETSGADYSLGEHNGSLVVVDRRGRVTLLRVQNDQDGRSLDVECEFQLETSK